MAYPFEGAFMAQPKRRRKSKPPHPTDHGTRAAEPPSDLTAIELFAGGGSVHLALAQAGIRVVWANDFDPMKQRVYRANLPDTPLDPRSIADVRGWEVPQARMVHGSWPCTDHSVQGQQAGFADGEAGRMAFHVYRLLGEMATVGNRPEVLVFENVLGLLHAKMAGDFDALLNGMVSAGYVGGALIVNADEFVPQNRPRLFVVAVRRDLAIPTGLALRGPCPKRHPAMLQRAYERLSLSSRAAWRWWSVLEILTNG